MQRKKMTTRAKHKMKQQNTKRRKRCTLAIRNLLKLQAFWTTRHKCLSATQIKSSELLGFSVPLKLTKPLWSRTKTKFTNKWRCFWKCSPKWTETNFARSTPRCSLSRSISGCYHARSMSKSKINRNYLTCFTFSDWSKACRVAMRSTWRTTGAYTIRSITPRLTLQKRNTTKLSLKWTLFGVKSPVQRTKWANTRLSFTAWLSLPSHGWACATAQLNRSRLI